MAKVASKKVSSKKATTGTKRQGKKSFKSYIAKTNKANKKGLTLSSKAAKVLNSFCFDMFDRIAVQAAAVARASKQSTLKASTMQTAVRLTLSGDLARHAAASASKAVLA